MAERTVLDVKLLNSKLEEAGFDEQEMHVIQILLSQCVKLSTKAEQPTIESVLAQLQIARPDIAWICIEDKLYSEEGCTPSRQSSIQLNNKIYGGASLSEALAAAMEGDKK